MAVKNSFAEMVEVRQTSRALLSLGESIFWLRVILDNAVNAFFIVVDKLGKMLIYIVF